MESQEKRRHIRVPLTLPITGKFRESLFRGHRFQGETLDLSYGGLGILTGNPNGFKAGQKVRFRIQLYSGDFRIRGKGTVCWVGGKNTQDRSMVMGVRLTKVMRYSTWCEKIEETLSK